MGVIKEIHINAEMTAPACMHESGRILMVLFTVWCGPVCTAGAKEVWKVNTWSACAKPFIYDVYWGTGVALSSITCTCTCSAQRLRGVEVTVCIAQNTCFLW